MELNKGLSINIHQVVIVKDKGILFANPLIKELMLQDSKEGQLMKSGAQYEEMFDLIQPNKDNKDETVFQVSGRKNETISYSGSNATLIPYLVGVILLLFLALILIITKLSKSKDLKP